MDSEQTIGDNIQIPLYEIISGTLWVPEYFKAEVFGIFEQVRRGRQQIIFTMFRWIQDVPVLVGVHIYILMFSKVTFQKNINIFLQLYVWERIHFVIFFCRRAIFLKFIFCMAIQGHYLSLIQAASEVQEQGAVDDRDTFLHGVRNLLNIHSSKYFFPFQIKPGSFC